MIITSSARCFLLVAKPRNKTKNPSKSTSLIIRKLRGEWTSRSFDSSLSYVHIIGKRNLSSRAFLNFGMTSQLLFMSRMLLPACFSIPLFRTLRAWLPLLPLGVLHKLGEVQSVMLL